MPVAEMVQDICSYHQYEKTINEIMVKREICILSSIHSYN